MHYLIRETELEGVSAHAEDPGHQRAVRSGNIIADANGIHIHSVDEWRRHFLTGGAALAFRQIHGRGRPLNTGDLRNPADLIAETHGVVYRIAAGIPGMKIRISIVA